MTDDPHNNSDVAWPSVTSTDQEGKNRVKQMRRESH